MNIKLLLKLCTLYKSSHILLTFSNSFKTNVWKPWPVLTLLNFFFVLFLQLLFLLWFFMLPRSGLNLPTAFGRRDSSLMDRFFIFYFLAFFSRNYLLYLCFMFCGHLSKQTWFLSFAFYSKKIILMITDFIIFSIFLLLFVC